CPASIDRALGCSLQVVLLEVAGVGLGSRAATWTRPCAGVDGLPNRPGPPAAARRSVRADRRRTHRRDRCARATKSIRARPGSGGTAGRRTEAAGTRPLYWFPTGPARKPS